MKLRWIREVIRFDLVKIDEDSHPSGVVMIGGLGNGSVSFFVRLGNIVVILKLVLNLGPTDSVWIISRSLENVIDELGICVLTVFLALSLGFFLSLIHFVFTMSQGNWITKSGGKKVEVAKPGLRITVPQFDNSELIASYSKTLIGRCMNPQKQDMKIFLFLLPRIWNVEGRVAGVDLELGRFQFNFDLEEDISRTIWVRVMDIPLQFRAAPIFQSVGEALGQVQGQLDLVGGRVCVELDGFKPLIFSVSIELEEGVEIMVTWRYEKLFGFCRECFQLTHDQSRCLTLQKGDTESSMARGGVPDGANATSYKAAVTTGNMPQDDRREGQQGRQQGTKGGDKGKGIARDRHAAYKQEGPYHPYREGFSKGYGEEVTRNIAMGQEYHSNNQPKLLADAFKGVSRSLGRDISRVPTLEATESSKTRKALLFDEPAMDVQDVAPIQVVEVRGEEQSREEHAEEKNAVEVEEAKVSEETLHSQALEANLMVEGVMLSDSELLLEDGEEGEEWEHGEIMDFAEEDVLNVENHEVGDQGDTSAQSIEEAQIEMEGQVDGVGEEANKNKIAQTEDDAAGGAAKKRLAPTFASPRKKLLAKAAAKAGEKGSKKASTKPKNPS
ncbi:hypothetical protein Bca52824_083760 [Brassica carinata]|nr:hypothetical protein Bca52824_083760 [Brassica carinata]